MPSQPWQQTLINATDLAANTYYYPTPKGRLDIDWTQHLEFMLQLTADADSTVTASIEGTDDVAAAVFTTPWRPINLSAYNLETGANLTGIISVTNAGPLYYTLDLDEIYVAAIRLVIVTSTTGVIGNTVKAILRSVPRN